MKLLVKLIQGLLWLLDRDHRSSSKIDKNNVKICTHIQPTDFESDFGRVSKVIRTLPYEVWELVTTTRTLYAADKHRVILADDSCVWLQDLMPGDAIKTDTGLDVVLSIRNLGIRTHMYCVEVETENQNDPNNHLYYTDGILSHNTTVASGYLLWKGMFVPDSTILVVANKFSQAIEVMERVRYCYENLPNHIRAGVTEYNKSSISFDNGSRIVSRATSADAGRGLAVSLLYADEFSFILPSKQKEFWTSIQPTLATGGGCIITSTPKNDEDIFAQLWKGAIDNTDEYGNVTENGVGRNGFFAVQVPWWEHPERDEEWAKPFRESLGEARFLQEFCCQFVSDDESLINPLTLSRLRSMPPISYTGTVRWYHDPEPNHGFLVALDPAMGTERNYGAIEAFQLPEMVQIAEWQSNILAPRHQVRVLMEILCEIEAILLEHPEQTGDPEIYWTFENNSLGEGPLTIIEDTGEDRFPGMLITERRRKGVQMRRVRRGLHTTARNKLAACARLKSLVESDRIVIHSNQLLKQLKTYVSSGVTFQAKPGEYDDLVSATLLTVRMLDVALAWGTDPGDLREFIADDEISGEPMPVVI